MDQIKEARVRIAFTEFENQTERVNSNWGAVVTSMWILVFCLGEYTRMHIVHQWWIYTMLIGWAGFITYQYLKSRTDKARKKLKFLSALDDLLEEK